MRVDEKTPPPDTVAYAEDLDERLWTGRGGGVWRCLTPAPGYRATYPSAWADHWDVIWRGHGPLVPLVPAGGLAVAAAAACLDRVDPERLPGDEPEAFRTARAVLDAAAYAPRYAGAPVPWAAGYVFGHCGHTMPRDEWAGGFLTCERCGHRTTRRTAVPPRTEPRA